MVLNICLFSFVLLLSFYVLYFSPASFSLGIITKITTGSKLQSYVLSKQENGSVDGWMGSWVDRDLTDLEMGGLTYMSIGGWMRRKIYWYRDR